MIMLTKISNIIIFVINFRAFITGSKKFYLHKSKNGIQNAVIFTIFIKIFTLEAYKKTTKLP